MKQNANPKLETSKGRDANQQHRQGGKVHGEKWSRKIIYGVNGLKTGGLTCGQQFCTLCLLTFSLLFAVAVGIAFCALFLTGLLGKTPWEAVCRPPGRSKRGEQRPKDAAYRYMVAEATGGQGQTPRNLGKLAVCGRPTARQ